MAEIVCLSLSRLLPVELFLLSLHLSLSISFSAKRVTKSGLISIKVTRRVVEECNSWWCYACHSLDGMNFALATSYLTCWLCCGFLCTQARFNLTSSFNEAFEGAIKILCEYIQKLVHPCLIKQVTRCQHELVKVFTSHFHRVSLHHFMPLVDELKVFDPFFSRPQIIIKSEKGYYGYICIFNSNSNTNSSCTGHSVIKFVTFFSSSSFIHFILSIFSLFKA